jgi:sodium/hydrogen antiporter
MIFAILLGLVVLLYSLFQRRLSDTPLTGPLIFTAVGLLVGTNGLRWITHADTKAAVELLETTLVVVLFSDAVGTNSSTWLRDSFLPGRLLLIGLPLTIIVGVALASPLFKGLDFWELVLLAAILAPTDATLVQPLISSRRVPSLIRNGLNVESGLNDGLVLPVVTIALALAASESGEPVSPEQVFLKALIYSTVIGAGIGWAGGSAILYSSKKGWSSGGWQSIGMLAIAVVAFETADRIGGSGFIAVWVAGFVVGLVVRDRLPRSRELPETLAQLGTAASFFVFGAVVLGPVLSVVTWQIVVYAILALTVMRMLPVAISLIGTRLRRPTVLFTGWFGPRGLATIVFASLVADEKIPGTSVLINTVVFTVSASILLHGLTSRWGADRYGRWFDRASAADPDIVENIDVKHAHVVRRLRVEPPGP